MEMLRGVVAVGFITAVSGCGAYNDFKTSNAIQEYRETCFGNYTNECASKLVDINIIMFELARSNISREKEGLVNALGQTGYERFATDANKVIDSLIERQENMRPGWFARWFLGEGQPFNNTGNQLFTAADMKALKGVLVERAVAARKAGAAGPHSATGAALMGQEVQEETPQTPTVPAPAAQVAAVEPAEALTPALEAAVDRVIANDVAEDGGAENKDGREVLFADLNGDGTNDAVVLYTIEGQGGGNGYYQSLATFYGHADGWDYRGKLVVGSGVVDIQLAGPKTFGLKVLTVGPDDADCCPSVENTQKYIWDGSTFVQTPNS